MDPDPIMQKRCLLSINRIICRMAAGAAKHVFQLLHRSLWDFAPDSAMLISHSPLCTRIALSGTNSTPGPAACRAISHGKVSHRMSSPRRLHGRVTRPAIAHRCSPAQVGCSISLSCHTGQQKRKLPAENQKNEAIVCCHTSLVYMSKGKLKSTKQKKRDIVTEEKI